MQPTTITARLTVFGLALLLTTAGAQATIVTYDSSTTPTVTEPDLIGRSLTSWSGVLGYLTNYQYGYNVSSATEAGIQFGVQLSDSPSTTTATTPSQTWTVNSFTVDQVDGTRPYLRDFWVYYGDNQQQFFSFANNQSPQTFTFASPVNTSYLLLVVTNTYQPAPNDWIGIQNISVNGTVLRTDTNVNVGATISVGNARPAVPPVC